MNTNHTLKEYSFHFFLTSVLRQIASSCNQEIFFDAQIPSDFFNLKIGGKPSFDAIASNGFDDISGPVIFDFKFYNQEIQYNRLLSILNSLYKRVMQLTFTDVTLILVTNSYIDSTIDLSKDISKKIPYKSNVDLKIWDQHKIEQLANLYPIDFSNAQNIDISSRTSENDIKISESDFELKNGNVLRSVRNIIKHQDNFAFVLGAGVSVDPGAKSWDELLRYFTSELKKKKIIDDEKKLSGKIGGSSIITAQLCKELYPNDIDYYWAIHQGLYEGRTAINPDYALYHIAEISKLCLTKSHFRILTYNYDNYLESYLDSLHVGFNTLYDSKCDINNQLSIYHVHGYLPEVKFKSYIEKRHQKSIYLTEENYNELYNHPYSWQISSQLSFFRENVCLFVGCSLADPNIRRLLEMTKKENRTHYAIMTKDKMTMNDLVKASNHFARIGIEVIWVNSYKEISDNLQLLY